MPATTASCVVREHCAHVDKALNREKNKKLTVDESIETIYNEIRTIFFPEERKRVCELHAACDFRDTTIVPRNISFLKGSEKCFAYVCFTASSAVLCVCKHLVFFENMSNFFATL